MPTTKKTQKYVTRLNKVLRPQGLVASHRSPRLTGAGEMVQSENLRRILFPWAVYRLSPNATSFTRTGDLVSEHRTLYEICRAYGVRIYPSKHQGRMFTDAELLGALRADNTRRDAAKILGVGATTVVPYLHALIHAGRIRCWQDGQRGKKYEVVEA